MYKWAGATLSTYGDITNNHDVPYSQEWPGDRINNLKNRFDYIIYMSKENDKVLRSQRKEGSSLGEGGENKNQKRLKERDR